MRYEGNHQKLKKNTATLGGTVNLKMTIATKQALKMCEMFNSLKNHRKFQLGSPINSEISIPGETTENYTSVKISGINYKIGTYIVVSIDDSEKEFGVITRIFLLQDEICFDLEKTFNKHYYAYVVGKNPVNSKAVKPNELPKYPPCFCVTTTNARFIIVKYRL